MTLPTSILPFARPFLVASLVAVAGCGQSPVLATYAGDDRMVTFMQADYERFYRVHVPKREELGPAAPLVLAFHGSSQTGEQLRAMSQLDQAADADGFIVVYLEAAMGNWDVFASLQFLGLDELAYVREVIDRVDRAYVMDAHRIIAVGLSNGGVMAQQLACMMPDRIAGFVAVSASMPRLMGANCRPGRGVSALYLLGTEDTFFPVGGSSSVLPVDGTLDVWAGVNGCGGARVRTARPDSEDDGTVVYASRYRSCSGGIRTELDSIVGGGHAWPGSTFGPVGGIGHTSHDVSANDEIVRFLHAIPGR